MSDSTPHARLSERSQVDPFLVMEMARAASEREAAGHDVLRLEVGQPSTGAPAGAIEAVKCQLDIDPLGYTQALGMTSLRERISLWYQERYSLDVGFDRIAVTTGASGACVLAFLGLFDVGDRVGVLTPGYPCYRNDLTTFGVEVVTIPVGFETGFRPNRELLDAAGELDGLILASPSNPTGTVLFDSDLVMLASWAEETDTQLIVDEIYHGIGVESPTALAYGDDIVVFNSFSKYFSMTGWRLGWLVVPPTMLGSIECLSQNLTISAPTVSQVAGLAAFDCTDELDQSVARYAHNRTILLDGLAEAGFDHIAPADGAFYAWTDVSHTGHSSTELSKQWLEELGISATPGLDFDLERGESFMRLSYAGKTADMEEAVRRIIRWSVDNNTRSGSNE